MTDPIKHFCDGRVIGCRCADYAALSATAAEALVALDMGNAGPVQEIALRAESEDPIDWEAEYYDLAAAVAHVWERGEGNGKFVILGMLRTALADPAAVLADRDRRVKAEAWDECREKASCDECHPSSGVYPPTPNPYREGGRA